jgi:hypothetical protein
MLGVHLVCYNGRLVAATWQIRTVFESWWPVEDYVAA